VDDRHDGRFSALARTTAFPATALAHLVLTGEVRTRGVVTMDGAVPAGLLVPEIAQVGIEVVDWP
jgi:saccharopine dehydrogenase-like NADP-dependent oxidoreductase